MQLAFEVMYVPHASRKRTVHLYTGLSDSTFTYGTNRLKPAGAVTVAVIVVGVDCWGKWYK